MLRRLGPASAVIAPGFGVGTEFDEVIPGSSVVMISGQGAPLPPDRTRNHWCEMGERVRTPRRWGARGGNGCTTHPRLLAAQHGLGQGAPISADRTRNHGCEMGERVRTPRRWGARGGNGCTTHPRLLAAQHGLGQGAPLSADRTRNHWCEMGERVRTLRRWGGARRERVHHAPEVTRRPARSWPRRTTSPRSHP